MAIKKNILAIDDSQLQLVIYQSVLSAEYNVHLCKSALRALEILKITAADIIIVDMDMPEMGGLEFIREIRKRRDVEKIPVIVVSSREDIAESLQYGADGYIQKPANIETLRKMIKEILD